MAKNVEQSPHRYTIAIAEGWEGMELRCFPAAIAVALQVLAPCPLAEATKQHIPRLQPGDIILRRGKSMASLVVLRLAPDSGYSHAGIVVQDGGAWSVIEAEPPSGSRPGGVVKTPLLDFLSPAESEAWKVLRLRSPLSAAPYEAARAASRLLGLPFDAEFRLDTERRLYCTELVWRSYLAAGVNLWPSAVRKARLGPLELAFIAPGDLERSPLLAAIGQFGP